MIKGAMKANVTNSPIFENENDIWKVLLLRNGLSTCRRLLKTKSKSPTFGWLPSTVTPATFGVFIWISFLTI